MSSNLGFSIEVKGADRSVKELTEVTGKIDQLDKANDRLKQKDPSKFFERQAAAMGMASKQSNQLAKSYEVLTNRSNTATISATNLTGVLSGFAAITAASRLIEMADAMALMHQRATVLAGGVEQGKQAFANMFDTAQRLGVSMTSVADSFTRMSPAMRQLGVDTQGTIQAVETLGKIIQLSGVSVQQANAGMLQFSQALASGKLAGDEFRSISENTPEVLNRLAASLGVTYGELRKMSTEGKLTSEVLTTFLAKSASSVNKDFEKLPETVGKSLQRLSNAFAIEIDKINQLGATSITSTFATGLNALASNLSVVTSAVGLLAAAFSGKLITSIAGAAKGTSAWAAISGQAAAANIALASTAAQEAEANVAVAASTLQAVKVKESAIAISIQERALRIEVASAALKEAEARVAAAAGTDKEAAAITRLNAAKAALLSQERQMMVAQQAQAVASTKVLQAQQNLASASDTLAQKTAALEQAKNKASIAARAMAGATNAAGAAMSALGGPIGVLIGSLALLITQWDNVTGAARAAQAAQLAAAGAGDLPTKIEGLLKQGRTAAASMEVSNAQRTLKDAEAQLAVTERALALKKTMGKDVSFQEFANVLKAAGGGAYGMYKNIEDVRKVYSAFTKDASELSQEISFQKENIGVIKEGLDKVKGGIRVTPEQSKDNLKEIQDPRLAAMKEVRNQKLRDERAAYASKMGYQRRDAYVEEELTKWKQEQLKAGVSMAQITKSEADQVALINKEYDKKIASITGSGKAAKAAAAEQKKLDSAFGSKFEELAQIRVKGELQVNNLLEGRTKNYGEHQAALAEQLKLDKELSALAPERQSALMEQARLADELVAKASLLNKITQESIDLEDSLYQAKLDLANLRGERGTESELERAKKSSDELIAKFTEIRQNPLTGVFERFIPKEVMDTVDTLISKAKELDNVKFDMLLGRTGKDNQKQLDDLQFNIDLITKTRAEKEKLNAVRQIELKYEDLLAEAAGTGADYEERRNQLLAQQAQQIAAINDLYAQQEAQRQNWQAGMQEGMNKYFDEITNFSEMVQSATEKAFKGVEDAFVKAAQTGKLSFKDMLKEIEADIIRMIVRKGMTEMFGTPSKGGGMDGGMLSGLLNNILGMGKSQAAPAALGGATYGNMFQGSSNLGGVATGLFDLVKGLFFDAGGYIGAGNVGIVGEKGPELVRGPAMVTGRKDTAEALGKGVTVVNNFTVSGAVDKRSQAQIAASVYSATQRAAVKYG